MKLHLFSLALLLTVGIGPTLAEDAPDANAPDPKLVHEFSTNMSHLIECEAAILNAVRIDNMIATMMTHSIEGVDQSALQKVADFYSNDEKQNHRIFTMAQYVFK